MLLTKIEIEERKTGKDLYCYQKEAISKIFKRFEEASEDYHLLYQLPTGGVKPLFFLKLLDNT